MRASDIITKPCQRCGKPVTRTTSRHLQRKYWTCSRACSALIRHNVGNTPGWQPNRFRGQRETRPCVQCGKPIERYLTEANHDRSWKCSRECMLAFQTGRQRRRRGQTQACQRCGTDFYCPPRRHRRFCSKECASQHKASQLLIKSCNQCGAEIRLRPSEINTRFCSLTCAALGRIKRPVGRSHNGKPVRQVADGYLKIWEPTHPQATRGWVLEHRWIMEQALGRHLTSQEEVDHINTDRADNRLENLQVLSRGDHRRKTGKDTRRARMTMHERLAEYERRFGPLQDV